MLRLNYDLAPSALLYIYIYIDLQGVFYGYFITFPAQLWVTQKLWVIHTDPEKSQSLTTFIIVPNTLKTYWEIMGDLFFGYEEITPNHCLGAILSVCFFIIWEGH